jgi:hypothetical protein
LYEELQMRIISFILLFSFFSNAFAIESTCLQLQEDLDHTSLRLLGLKDEVSTLGDYYHQLTDLHAQKQFYDNLKAFVQSYKGSEEVSIVDWVTQNGHSKLELINQSCGALGKDDVTQIEIDNCQKHLSDYQKKPKKFNSLTGDLNKKMSLVENKIKKIVSTAEHTELEDQFKQQSTDLMQKCPKQMKNIKAIDKDEELVCSPVLDNSNINVLSQLSKDVSDVLVVENVKEKHIRKEKKVKVKAEKCPPYAHLNPETQICEEDKELLKVYQQNIINNKRAWGNVAKVSAVVAGVGGVSLLTVWGMKAIFDKQKNKQTFYPYNSMYQYQQLQSTPPMQYPPYHFNYFNSYGSGQSRGFGQLHNPYEFQFGF